MSDNFVEKKVIEITKEGRMVEEEGKVKEIKVRIMNGEGYVKIVLNRKEKYTRVKVNEKDVMIYIGENRKGTRWLTEINNEVKSHLTREDAERYITGKMSEMIKYLGEKAGHIYRVGKTKEYNDGNLIKHEYGNLEIMRIDRIDDSWSVHVLGRSVWLFETREEAEREGRNYFIRYYIEREFIESPWGNYMGSYIEIIEQYTQKLIDKERFKSEKKSLYEERGKRKEKALMEEYFKRADSEYVIVAAEACMCIGKYYLSEMFDKGYERVKAIALLNDIKEGIKDRYDRESMDNFINKFDEIKKIAAGNIG